mgnify:CR=1 FL=1
MAFYKQQTRSLQSVGAQARPPAKSRNKAA